MILIILLTLIGIALLFFGCVYAMLIYHRPFGPGWTWASVALGVAFTIIGEIAAIIVTLAYLDLLHQLWWISLYPLAAFALTGLPMVYYQNKKRLDQKKQNHEIDKELKTDES